MILLFIIYLLKISFLIFLWKRWNARGFLTLFFAELNGVSCIFVVCFGAKIWPRPLLSSFHFSISIRIVIILIELFFGEDSPEGEVHFFRNVLPRETSCIQVIRYMAKYQLR